MRSAARGQSKEALTVEQAEEAGGGEGVFMETESKEKPRPRTKIVATLGPASAGRVGELIEEGMSIARINFSHGDRDDLRELIASVRIESKARHSSVGILCDLPGPKMRLGRFEGGSLELVLDEVYILRYLTLRAALVMTGAPQRHP